MGPTDHPMMVPPPPLLMWIVFIFQWIGCYVVESSTLFMIRIDPWIYDNPSIHEHTSIDRGINLRLMRCHTLLFRPAPRAAAVVWSMDLWIPWYVTPSVILLIRLCNHIKSTFDQLIHHHRMYGMRAAVLPANVLFHAPLSNPLILLIHWSYDQRITV